MTHPLARLLREEKWIAELPFRASSFPPRYHAKQVHAHTRLSQHVYWGKIIASFNTFPSLTLVDQDEFDTTVLTTEYASTPRYSFSTWRE